MFERFHTTGVAHKRMFTQHNAYIAGVGGDGIQNMLFRLDTGLLESCADTLQHVVLCAGTNNLEKFDAEDIVDGIRNLLDVIKKKRPSILVSVLGILPRTSTENIGNFEHKIAIINAQLLKVCATLSSVSYIEPPQVSDNW